MSEIDVRELFEASDAMVGREISKSRDKSQPRSSFVKVILTFALSSAALSLTFASDCTIGHLSTFYGHAAVWSDIANVATANRNAVLAQENQESGSTKYSNKSSVENEMKWNALMADQRSEESSPSKPTGLHVEQYTADDGSEWATLSWECTNATRTIVSYASWSSELQICRYKDFSQFVKEYTAKGYSSYSLSFNLSKQELTRNVQYWARARRRCECNTTTESEWGYFTFTLAGKTITWYDADVTTELKGSKWFVGNLSLANNTASAVNLTVSHSPDFSNLVGAFSFPLSTSDTSLSVDLSALGWSTQPYYLKFSTSDTAGNATDWTSAGSFSIPKSATDDAAPKMTEYSASVVDGCLACEWTEPSDESGIKCYEIHVATDAAFKSEVLRQYQDTQRFQLDVAGSTNNCFYVRVRAQDKAGNWGSWGAGVAAVKNIAIVESVSVCQSGSRNRMMWWPVEGAASYDCQWSADGFSTVHDLKATASACHVDVVEDSSVLRGARDFRVRARTADGRTGEWTAVSYTLNSPSDSSDTYRSSVNKLKAGTSESRHIGWDVSMSSRLLVSVGNNVTRMCEVINDRTVGGFRTFRSVRTFDSDETSVAVSEKWYAIGGGSDAVGGRVRLGRADKRDEPCLTLWSPNAEPGGGFGTLLAFSDAATLIVVAMYENNGYGRIYVYVNSGDEWKLKQTIDAPNATQNECFAQSMSASGDWLFVGCVGYDFNNPERESFGACRVYRRNSGGLFKESQILTGRTLFQAFGTCVCVNGERAAVSMWRDWLRGGDATSGGSVMYRLGDGGWIEDGYLKPGMIGIGESHAGGFVSVAGDWACIAGILQDNVCDSTVVTNGGSVVLFHRDQGTWNEVKRLYPHDPSANQNFGLSMAICNDVLAVGAPENTPNGQGSVYAYSLWPTNFESVVATPNAEKLKPYFNIEGGVTFDCSALKELGDIYELEMDSNADYSHPIVSVRGSAQTVQSSPLTLRAYVYRARVRKNGMWSNWSRDAVLDLTNADGTGADTYSIVFVANGGSGKMSEQLFVRGLEQRLAANAFARVGYEFAGWSRSTAGTVCFLDNQPALDIASDGQNSVTLYAQWEKTPVSLSSIAISVSGASSVTSASSATFTCTASYSDGSTKTVVPTWSISSGSGYAAISSSGVLTAKTVSSDQTVTVKASYEEGGITKTATMSVTVSPVPVATYTVTYKPGSYGTGAQQTATKTAGVTQTLMDAIFTRTGYTQTGWATSDDGAKVYSLGASYTVDAPLTLYPYWTVDPDPVDPTPVDPDPVLEDGGPYVETVDGVEWTFMVKHGKVSIGSKVGIEYGRAISDQQSGAITIPSVLGGSPVTSVGSDAFKSCALLTSITIPQSVTYVGGTSFMGCDSLESFVVDPANETFYARDGVLYEHGVNGDELLEFCPRGKSSVLISSETTVIDDYSFKDCNLLRSVSVPSSVKVLGFGVFWGCKVLESVTFSPGVTQICDYAFLDCPALSTMCFPSTLQKIGIGALGTCPALMTVDFEGLPPTGLSEIHISSNAVVRYSVNFASQWEAALASCPFTGYPYDQQIDPVDPTPALQDGGPYTNLIDGVAWRFFIEDGEATVGGGGTSQNGNAVVGDCLGDVAIPEVLGGCPVCQIGAYAFWGCEGLTSITIPSSVREIEYDAFEYCRGLTAIQIPSGVESVGTFAFSECTGLESVTIPSSLMSIGMFAFSGCDRLTSVWIPAGVEYIADGAFATCENLTSIQVDSENEDYCSVDGVLFSKDRGSLRCYPAGLKGDYALPEEVTQIAGNAFWGCGELTSVTLTPNVTDIGSYAFAFSKSMRTIAIPSTVSRISQNSFYNSGLVSVTLSSGVKSIGKLAFGSCYHLKSIVIPSSVDEIQTNAFAWTDLSTVYVDAGDASRIRNLLAASGCDCSGMTFKEPPWSYEVTYMPGAYGAGPQQTVTGSVGSDFRLSGAIFNRDGYVQSGWSEDATGDCLAYELEESYLAGAAVTLYPYWSPADPTPDPVDPDPVDPSPEPVDPDPVDPSPSPAEFLYKVVDGCAVLTNYCGDGGDVVIPSTIDGYCVSELGNCLFYGNGAIRSVVISEGVTEIGMNAFSNCSSLREVEMPSGLTTIGSEAFINCDSLSSIYIPSSVQHINLAAFGYERSPLTVIVDEGDEERVRKMFGAGYMGGIALTFVSGYTVAFSSNEGDESVLRQDSTVRRFDETFNLAPNEFVRSGYVFAGWSMAPTGTVAFADGEAVSHLTDKSDGQIVLYAVWMAEESVSGVSFASAAVLSCEGGSLNLSVVGGSANAASSVDIYLTALSATVKDLSQTGVTLDGRALADKLAFPITIRWNAGEIGAKRLTIPVSADKAVEGDESLIVQLANPQGQELGGTTSCLVTIHDAGYDTLKTSIDAGTASSAEKSTWKKLREQATLAYVAGLADSPVGGKVTGAKGVKPDRNGAYKAVTLKATPAKDHWFAGWYDAKDDLVGSDLSFKMTPTDDDAGLLVYSARFVEADTALAGTYGGLASVNLRGMTVVKNAWTTSDVIGLYPATLTLSAAGKISGSVTIGGKKAAFKGETCVLSGAGLAVFKATMDEKAWFGRANSESLLIGIASDGSAMISAEAREGDYAPLSGEESAAVLYKSVGKDGTSLGIARMFAGTYSVVLPDTENGLTALSVAIDAKGKAKVSGRFRDGTSLAYSGALCGCGSQTSTNGVATASARLVFAVTPKTLGAGSCAVSLALSTDDNDGSDGILGHSAALTVTSYTQDRIESFTTLDGKITPYEPGCWLPEEFALSYPALLVASGAEAITVPITLKDGVAVGLGKPSAGYAIKFDNKTGLFELRHGKEYTVHGIFTADGLSVGRIEANGTLSPAQVK